MLHPLGTPRAARLAKSLALPRSALSTGSYRGSLTPRHLRWIAVAATANANSGQKVPGGVYWLPPAVPLAQGASS
jgi:hypothetical protein